MNKFQPVKFISINDFNTYISKQEKKLVDYIREIIIECMPDAREKLSFNVPAFYRYSKIIYLWPSSVPWGNVPEGAVSVGFPKGHLMRDELNYLEKGERKQVFTKTFSHPDEIDVGILKTYIFEAIRVDENQFRNKNL